MRTFEVYQYSPTKWTIIGDRGTYIREGYNFIAKEDNYIWFNSRREAIGVLKKHFKNLELVENNVYKQMFK